MAESSPPPLRWLVLATLGVVYGDIGTSPLYAVRECFSPTHGVEPTPANILGILSLIFWSLVLVVCVKYLLFVLRADNQGEGGELAITALVSGADVRQRSPRLCQVLFLMGLCGTCLLVVDGLITPAISVLSAVEGLEVATPVFKRAVIPITVAILTGLFAVQSRGTAKIGSVFGPVMLVWFAAIGVLGLRAIWDEPRVLEAIHPAHAVNHFLVHRWQGVVVLGAVVLCVTGCEALFADLGHFGRRPITIAWLALVFPAVVLSYFGQGALLLARGAAVVRNPFYELAPPWLLFPLVALATMATVIASQSLISGMFSLTRQAMRLRCLPRLTVIHTSDRVRGQIFIPEVNVGLAIGCVALVLGFRSSSDLAAAYGLAVVGTMSITATLLFFVARWRWGWSRWRAGLLASLLLTMDAAFLAGNVTKIVHGGWLVLLMGAGMLVVLTTWIKGREIISRKIALRAIPLAEFVELIRNEPIPRVKGTAVFMSAQADIAPRVLLHHLKHNKVLHEQVVLATVIVEDLPRVPEGRRLEIRALGHGFYKLLMRQGFMEELDVGAVVDRATAEGLPLKGEVSFYLGRLTLRTTGTTPMRAWRRRLFAYLFNHERPATALFGIVPNRVIELGEQMEI